VIFEVNSLESKVEAQTI